jgi:menaquinone-dependent protoporphyrinogen IX oxidase
MPQDKDLIFDKIQQFEIEIEKATCDLSLFNQLANLERVYNEIENYFKKQVETTDKESMIIGVFLGAMKFIKDKYINSQFIKDPKKDKENKLDRINNIKWRMKTELKVFKDYVTDDKIILKRS